MIMAHTQTCTHARAHTYTHTHTHTHTHTSIRCLFSFRNGVNNSESVQSPMWILYLCLQLPKEPFQLRIDLDQRWTKDHVTLTQCVSIVVNCITRDHSLDDHESDTTSQRWDGDKNDLCCSCVACLMLWQKVGVRGGIRTHAHIRGPEASNSGRE